MLELKDALLSVGGHRLFHRLSFMARDGQLTCLTGPHGAGKTMLVRVMVGLQPLDEGFVSIDGELLTPLSAPTFRRMMAYLPQPVTPAAVDFVPETDDLECVWAGNLKPHPRPLSRGRGEWSDSALECIYSPLPPREGPGVRLERLRVGASAGMGSGVGLFIADDPSPSLLDYLKSQAQQGRTVIVATQLQEFLQAADQLITLEPYDSPIPN